MTVLTMKKKLPENFNTENCRYVGDDDFGLYYFVTKKGWLKPRWYTTAVFRLREYIMPKDWMIDRGPSSTEENAWLVGKTVSEQLYEEWRPTWQETYLSMRDLWDTYDWGPGSRNLARLQENQSSRTKPKGKEPLG